MSGLSDRRWAMVSVIILLIAGVSLLSPVRVGIMLSEERYSYVAQPNVWRHEQIPISIPHGQYAQIAVQFEENVSWEYSYVRLDIIYRYPTKEVGEGMQYEVENNAELLLGWEDGSCLKILVVAFGVAITFQANETASVNLTIAKMMSVTYWTGMVSLFLSVPLLWYAQVRDCPFIGRGNRRYVLAYVLILAGAIVYWRAYLEIIIPAGAIIAVIAARRGAKDLGAHPKTFA